MCRHLSSAGVRGGRGGNRAVSGRGPDPRPSTQRAARTTLSSTLVQGLVEVECTLQQTFPATCSASSPGILEAGWARARGLEEWLLSPEVGCRARGLGVCEERDVPGLQSESAALAVVAAGCGPMVATEMQGGRKGAPLSEAWTGLRGSKGSGEAGGSDSVVEEAGGHGGPAAEGLLPTGWGGHV